MIRRLTGPSLLLAALSLAVGCGGGEATRYHVSGTVTHAGRPVTSGRIYFAPDPARGNDGPQGYATIENGRYDTAKGGEPAAGGPVVVRIDGYDPPTADYPHGKPLFIEYKVAAELPREAATKDFDVPTSAAMKLPTARPEAGP
jgi:hypothetical protein